MFPADKISYAHTSCLRMKRILKKDNSWITERLTRAVSLYIDNLDVSMKVVSIGKEFTAAGERWLKIFQGMPAANAIDALLDEGNHLGLLKDDLITSYSKFCNSFEEIEGKKDIRSRLADEHSSYVMRYIEEFSGCKTPSSVFLMGNACITHMESLISLFNNREMTRGKVNLNCLSNKSYSILECKGRFTQLRVEGYYVKSIKQADKESDDVEFIEDVLEGYSY